LSRYIKIRTGYPGRIPGAQAPDSFMCECEFILEGIKAPSKLTFDDSGLKETYDPKSRTDVVPELEQYEPPPSASQSRQIAFR